MGKLNNFRARIADEFNISEEVLLDVPKVSVVGRNKIIIENHKSILEFSKSVLRVASSIGTIYIYGDNMEVLFMGDETIVVSGTFNSLNYEEEKEWKDQL